MNKTDYQTICFNGNDFTNFMNFVKSLNSKDKSKYSRIVVLHVEDDKLVCKAIDDTYNYIEYYVELYESDNIITDTLAISISDLLSLIKCANSNKFTIRKCFNQYEFNIIGNGWLPFNIVEIDLERYNIDGEVSNIGSVNSLKLRDAISSIVSYTQEYTYVRDMYIKFKPDQMIVSSRSSGVVTFGEFTNMTLHRDNASRLKILLKDDFTLMVNKVSSSANRLSFVGPNFKFVLIDSDVECAEISNKRISENYLKISSEELYKLVVFAEEYSASKKIIGLTIKNNKLIVNIKNNLTSNHNSVIKSESVGNSKDTHEAVIVTRSLLKALKLFQDKHSREINIYFDDELLKNESCIIIFDDTTHAIVNISNR